MKAKLGALIILVVTAGLAVYVFQNGKTQEHFGFTLGLDLAGGTLLTYRADVSGVDPSEVGDAMNSLREVIERRVNVFGVSEPLVQTEHARLAEGREERLIVELPGITDVDAAVASLGETPVLEFKLLGNSDTLVAGAETEPTFVDTGLTGRFLQSAQLQFGQSSAASVVQEPIVALTFNDQGADLFAQITRDHQGEILAIFLDGVPISTPVIQAEITDGKAIITGLSGAEEARDLVRNLNFGALPVPITLVGAESIGAVLGSELAQAGVMAGMWGFLIIAVFMIVWYRLPGLVSVLALALYALALLTLFRVIPVTLTAPGIAGFILSIGLAVDANILIFERLKEEFQSGRALEDAIREGFARAWLSIRDGNLTTIFGAIILFYTTSSLVKGFALVLLLGVVLSMLTAISITRTLLLAVVPKTSGKTAHFLFGSGLSR